MIMCVLLCYPVSIRIYYQQCVLFLVDFVFVTVTYNIGLKYVVQQLLHVLYHGEVSKV